MEYDDGDIDDNDVEQDKSRIGDDPGTISVRHLGGPGGEELEELILKKENVFNNDLP